MKKPLPTQLIVGLGILLIGGGIVGGEYFLVNWYPRHKARVQMETLAPIPYKNDALGIELQVAAGINRRVEVFPGGVRIYSPRLLGKDPSITITSQPNPDGSHEFTPQQLALWETAGALHDIPSFKFEHTQINNRDAVLTWQYKNRAMLLTARIIAPDRIVEANCTTGSADEDLYMEACDESARSIKVAGPQAPPSSESVGEMNAVPSPSPAAQ